jgi:hypothetical protein
MLFLQRKLMRKKAPPAQAYAQISRKLMLRAPAEKPAAARHHAQAYALQDRWRADRVSCASLLRARTVDAFSYLSVLISIILGLAVTQVLQGFRGLLLARVHVRMYWPALAWTGLVLVICVQVWWAMFGLSERPAARWTFLDFGLVLLQTVPLYLMAGLVLPDVDREHGLDLREHYFAHHRWFFALLVLLIMVSIAKVRVLTDTWPRPADVGFQLAFAAGALVGAWTHREWYHKLLAPLATVGIVAYITALFTHLG